MKRVYEDKDVQEWIVRSSGLAWTIVRPGLLKDGPATGSYRVLTAPMDWRFGAISRADVADFLVRQVDDRTLIGTTPLLIRYGSVADLCDASSEVRFVPRTDIDTFQIPLRFDLHQPLTTANEISSLER